MKTRVATQLKALAQVKLCCFLPQGADQKEVTKFGIKFFGDMEHQRI